MAVLGLEWRQRGVTEAADTASATGGCTTGAAAEDEAALGASDNLHVDSRVVARSADEGIDEARLCGDLATALMLAADSD